MSDMSIRGVGPSPVQDRSARERSQYFAKHDEAQEQEQPKSLVEQEASVFVLTDQRIHSCEILQTLHDLDIAIVLLQTIGIFLLQLEQELIELQNSNQDHLIQELEKLEEHLLKRRHNAQQLSSGEHRQIVISIDNLIAGQDPLVLSMKPFGISLKTLGFKDEHDEWSSLSFRSGTELLLKAQKIIKEKQQIAADYEQRLEEIIIDLMSEELSNGAISPTKKVEQAVSHLSDQLKSQKSFRSMLKKIDVGVLKDGYRRLL